MIKKIIFYISVFLLSLAVFLVVSMPASFLWEKVLAPQVNTRSIGLDVISVEGTIWDGRGLIRYQSISSIIDWDISFLGLFGMSLPVHLDIESQVGDAELTVELGLKKIALELKSAKVDVARLDSLVRKYKVSLDGQLEVKNLVVDISDQKVQSANGSAWWSGGDIAYPVGRERHERNMPAFNLKVDTLESGVVALGIRDVDASFDVMEGSLTPDGEAMFRVTRRLLDISNEAWPQNSREQDVVFKVKKMIY